MFNPRKVKGRGVRDVTRSEAEEDPTESVTIVRRTTSTPRSSLGGSSTSAKNTPLQPQSNGGAWAAIYSHDSSITPSSTPRPKLESEMKKTKNAVQDPDLLKWNQTKLSARGASKESGEVEQRKDLLNDFYEEDHEEDHEEDLELDVLDRPLGLEDTWGEQRLLFGHAAVQQLQEQAEQERRLGVEATDMDDLMESDPEEEEHMQAWERHMIKKGGARLNADFAQLQHQPLPPPRIRMYTEEQQVLRQALDDAKRAVEESTLDADRLREEQASIERVLDQMGGQLKQAGVRFDFYQQWTAWLSGFIGWSQVKRPQARDLSLRCLRALQSHGQRLEAEWKQSWLQALTAVGWENESPFSNHSSSSTATTSTTTQPTSRMDSTPVEKEFMTQLELVLKEWQGLTADTDPAFAQVDNVMARMQRWKFQFTQDFQDAFIAMTIPGLLEMYVFQSLWTVWLRPLWRETEPYTELSELSWHTSVTRLDLEGSQAAPLLLSEEKEERQEQERDNVVQKHEMDDSLLADPVASDILQQTVEKYILPFLNQWIIRSSSNTTTLNTTSLDTTSGFTPTSSQHMRFISNALENLSYYYDDTHPSNPLPLLLHHIVDTVQHTLTPLIHSFQQHFKATTLPQWTTLAHKALELYLPLVAFLNKHGRLYTTALHHSQREFVMERMGLTGFKEQVLRRLFQQGSEMGADEVMLAKIQQQL